MGSMPPHSELVVVDSDRDWRHRVSTSLEPLRYTLRSCSTAREVLEAAQEEPPALIVCELFLADMSGFGLCRSLRESPKLADVGVLMVSSYADEIDRVLAFEAGVDDFLPKPFFDRELQSRAAAILRRSHRIANRTPATSVHPSNAGVSIDRDACCIRIGGDRVEMTPRETDIMAALIEGSGRVITRGELLERVWGSDAEGSKRVVDAHVKAIRRKLGPIKHRIETVRGIGYRFSDSPV